MAGPTIDIVERGQGVDYYSGGGRLLAVAVPPRPWDLPDQWRAIGADGRTVEVNTRADAMRRAQRYAEIIAGVA